MLNTMRVALTGLSGRRRPTNSPRKSRLAELSLGYEQPKTRPRVGTKKPVWGDQAYCFFPLVSNQVDNASPQMVTPTSRGVQITIKKAAQLALAPRSIPALKGVLELGTSQAYEIVATLPTP